MIQIYKSNANQQITNKICRLELYRGQAALIAVLFMLAITLSAVFGIIALAFKELRAASENNKAKNSYFIAEAGIEDAVYRLMSGKAVGSSYTMSLNGSSAVITISAVSASERNIVSAGDSSGSNRSLSASLLTDSVGANFYYGLQVSDGGLDMGNNAVINGNVYSNGNIVGKNGSMITGNATVAGGISSTPSIEWTAHDSDFNFATVSGNRDVAQSFTANLSDRVNKVSVYIKKVGNPSSSLTLRITGDNGGRPDNSDMASAAISQTYVGSNVSWVDVSFSSPPNLTSGSKYWIVLDYGTNSATNYWVWRLDGTDAYAANTGKYASNWNTGNPSWTDAGGDFAFKVWIGGVNTKIDGLIIGDAESGEGHANVFVNTNIHGSDCPSQYCFVENPPREELPFSDGVIQDWRDAAAAGGTCVPPQCDSSGNFIIAGGASASLGPKKITGNLEVDNLAALTVTGTIWVLGEVKLSNNCSVSLSPAYGNLSGLVLTDSKASVSNGCVFSGSGDPASYFMLFSAKNSPAEEVMVIDNNAVGVIYYASNGRIKFSNGAAAKEATAYGITIDNNAAITYESGLANVNFASGPSGGWDIKNWQEIIP